jgi:hypothetical protein
MVNNGGVQNMQITFEQGVAAVLEYLMDEVRDSHELIDYLADYIDCESIPVLNYLNDKDYKKLERISHSQWEKKFKEHFGFTDHQYIDQAQMAIRVSLTEKERELLKEMESICTVRFTFDPQTGLLGGTYYQRTPKKLAWRPNERNGGNWCSGVSFNTDGWTGEMGWTFDEVEAFLVRLGATKKKRPVHKRIHSYSLYD